MSQSQISNTTGDAESQQPTMSLFENKSASTQLIFLQSSTNIAISPQLELKQVQAKIPALNATLATLRYALDAERDLGDRFYNYWGVCHGDSEKWLPKEMYRDVRKRIDELLGAEGDIVDEIYDQEMRIERINEELEFLAPQEDGDGVSEGMNTDNDVEMGAGVGENPQLEDVSLPWMLVN